MIRDFLWGKCNVTAVDKGISDRAYLMYMTCIVGPVLALTGRPYTAEGSLVFSRRRQCASITNTLLFGLRGVRPANSISVGRVVLAGYRQGRLAPSNI